MRKIMKRLFLTVAYLLVIGITNSDARTSEEVMQEIKKFTDSIKGKELYLRITVLRVSARGRFSIGKATDATNIFPDGNVYYQGMIEGGVQVNTQDPKEFTAEARRKLLAAKNNKAAVLSIDRGAKIIIHDVEIEDDETRIQITVPGSFYSEIKSTLRFKMFEEVNSLDVFKKMFDVAFAEEEYEVKRIDKTTVVENGMTVDDLIRLMGNADYRINLSEKTILVYDNFKYIFFNNRLADFD